MDEFKQFKNKRCEIKLMSDYDEEYDFYSKKGVYVIIADYSGGDNHPIHYDYCHSGNEVFRQWLNKHNFAFEWYGCCIGVVYQRP